jgi:hypothetical protein
MLETESKKIKPSSDSNSRNNNIEKKITHHSSIPYIRRPSSLGASSAIKIMVLACVRE